MRTEPSIAKGTIAGVRKASGQLGAAEASDEGRYAYRQLLVALQRTSRLLIAQRHLPIVSVMVQRSLRFLDRSAKPRVSTIGMLLLVILAIVAAHAKRMQQTTVLYVLALGMSALRLYEMIAGRDNADTPDTMRKENQFAPTAIEKARVAKLDARITELEVDIATKLTFLSEHDALTGLANRRLLIRHFSERIAAGAIPPSKDAIVIFCVNIDDFRNVNESFGHAAGNTILCTVAQRILASVAPDDLASRAEGDGFIVVANCGEDPCKIAARIQAAIVQPIAINNTTIALGTSIGISFYPGNGTDPETLIDCATVAMKQAKHDGRNAVAIYTRSTHPRSQRIMVASELRAAGAANQYVVYYQPIISIATGRVTGAEALVRWEHPQRGLLQPAEFINVAEEIGTILDITTAVLHDACQQIKVLSLHPDVAFTISVNVSAYDLRRPGFADFVGDIFRHHGNDPARIDLEITERVMGGDSASTITTLHALKRLGVKISIDDFGTGYSSLSYIKHFPIDNLKIEKSFVDDIADSETDQCIARTIIDLAHSMHMTVIAEGVETAEQLRELGILNADKYQGYYASEPLTPEKFATFVRRTSSAISGPP